MSDAGRIRDIENKKARRKAAREMIGQYHEQQLQLLLEHVREGFHKLDAGELDPFELDDLIHHYKRAARSCGASAALADPAGRTRR